MLKDVLSRPWVIALSALVAGGCQSYVTPGRAADMSVFMKEGKLDTVRETDERSAPDLSLAEILAREPMAAFPTGIAVARVQESGYRSETVRQTAGQGAYTVITERASEEEEGLERLGALPQVLGVAPVNRLLVPRQLRSDLELRKVAAQLHADLLLIYTLDTAFEMEDRLPPLTLVSLGLLRTNKARVHSTASALVLDTRTGYVYATAEASAEQAPSTSAWTSASKVDALRRATEKEAFERLVTELENAWDGVVATHARLPNAGARAGG